MRTGALIALVTGMFAGCAGHPSRADELASGTPRPQVLALLGQPTRVVPVAGGERLQYSLQPLGQAAWMVDLDAAGRVLRSRQVLTAPEFNRIEPGSWSRADVEREFGPPARVDRIARWPGPIMTYRWNDGSDMFYWVYLDAANVVRRAHPGMEFINAPDRE